MITDTNERGLENLICTALTSAPCDPGAVPADAVREKHCALRRQWLDRRPARGLRPRPRGRPG